MESMDLDRILSEARDVLKDKALQNTQRILILTTLYLTERLGFTELARVTGIDKGKLEYHINVLEKEGYVERRMYITILGPRLFIKITSKGKERILHTIKVLAEIINK